MINLYDLDQVYLVCGRTDMRRGIDGLAAIVKDKFNLDPFSGKGFLKIHDLDSIINNMYQAELIHELVFILKLSANCIFTVFR